MDIVEFRDSGAERGGMPPQVIPRIIHQTHSREFYNEKLAATVRTILDCNPEYDYRFSDDEECREWMRKNTDSTILRAYDSLIPKAYKADLWRYCVLYRYGGVYLDCKIIELVPLREVVRPFDRLILVRDLCPSYLLNAIMAATPEQGLFRFLIDEGVEQVLRKDMGRDFLDVLGPGFLGRMFTVYFKCPIGLGYGPDYQIWRHVMPGPDPSRCYTAVAGSDDPVFMKQYPDYYKERKEDYVSLYRRGLVFG